MFFWWPNYSYVISLASFSSYTLLDSKIVHPIGIHGQVNRLNLLIYMDRYEDDGLHTCLMKFPEDWTPEQQGKQTDIKYIKNVWSIYLLIGDKVKQIIPI